MPKVFIVRDKQGDGFHVWIALPHTEEHELPTAPESFVIASGETPADALRNGLKALDDVRLQLINVEVKA